MVWQDIRYCLLLGAILLFAGCKALMSLNSVDQSARDILSIGERKEFVMSFPGFDTVKLTICYDITNHSYFIDAGTEIGRFRGMAKDLGKGRIWMSITIDDTSLRKSLNQLTEVEGGFLAKIFLNVMLEKRGKEYVIFLLQRSEDLAGGCHIANLIFNDILDADTHKESLPLQQIGVLYESIAIPPSK